MKILLGCLAILLTGCSSNKKQDPILKALNSDATAIKTVMANLDDFEVQIKLSRITKNNDTTLFEDYEFQVDSTNYFYPASTVKFPASILTLEKLNETQSYTIDTPFYVEGDSLITTFRKDIIDIFAVSSNDTYNRLFEFLGKDYINKKLKSKGLTATRIAHRLSTNDANNLKTKSLIFTMNDSTLAPTYSTTNTPIAELNLKKLKKGIGYYRDGKLINEPMDFSSKNYISVNTLHGMMKRLMFPEAFHESERFNLTEKDRSFLINTMSILPKDGGYTDADHYDSYVKFFIYGDSKKPMPNHIKIHNKVGYAYGYLTDCAYIKDTKANIDYILTATIHVNQDGIFNNDIYEYDDIGIPFLAELGRNIHKQLTETNN